MALAFELQAKHKQHHSFMTSPLIINTISALREQVNSWKSQNLRVGLVPTMGSLHHGHLSLVTTLMKNVDRVVVSIFVNPTQFGPGEDYDTYPRTLESDSNALESVGAHAIYAPTAREMYPEGFASTVHVSGLTEGLCGASRPAHFDGVATVVSKLLNQCQPDQAIFGEKDYQQLQVIKQFVHDLDMPIAILGGAIVRDDDGLAASSRNAYLSVEERQNALALPQTLNDLAQRARGGEPLADLEKEGTSRLLEAGFQSVEYVTFCDAETLATPAADGRSLRLLAAARIGSTRLIDNQAV